ncbi:MAG: hypothetical protein AB1425_11060 [Actinomycetota bacterium]
MSDAAYRRRVAALRRRRFLVLVMVPFLLMLGSVYVHAWAGDLRERVAGLEERLSDASVEGERLEIRVAELSRAERIRRIASGELHMRDPRGSEMKVYGKENGEDGRPDEVRQERAIQR